MAETLDVTSKPMIYDADTGGKPEIFRFTVRSLEKLGVSAAIIEDKAGLKQNSLFGTERKQEVSRRPGQRVTLTLAAKIEILKIVGPLSPRADT